MPKCRAFSSHLEADELELRGIETRGLAAAKAEQLHLNARRVSHFNLSRHQHRKVVSKGGWQVRIIVSREGIRPRYGNTGVIWPVASARLSFASRFARRSEWCRSADNTRHALPPWLRLLWQRLAQQLGESMAA